MPTLNQHHECYFAGCHATVVRGERYCARHHEQGTKERLNALKDKPKRARPSAYRRGYGGANWRKLRRQTFQKHPMCVMCRQRPSTQCDHIIPKSKGGTDHPDNLQGLCNSCHSRKTMTQDVRKTGSHRGIRGLRPPSLQGKP